MEYAGNDVDERNVIHISRPVFDQKAFDDLYVVRTVTDDVNKGNALNRLRVHFQSCSLNKLLCYFPVIKHWKEYRVKEYLLNDIVSGISGGVVHVPQVRYATTHRSPFTYTIQVRYATTHRSPFTYTIQVRAVAVHANSENSRLYDLG